MASNMAELFKELFGIDFALLTIEERGELAESMLSAGRVNEKMRATAGSWAVAEVTGWPLPAGETGLIAIDEREAREGIADDCIMVFNALEALKRHAHAAP